MKFALSTVLLAATLGAVMAQDPSSSSASPSVSSTSSAASSTSSSAAAGGGEDGASSAASAPAATCTLVSGDPQAQAFGCPEGAVTSTPPYDSASLQSFLIGGYSHGKEGTAYSEVAEMLADSVTELYPTLTQDYSAIVDQYAAALALSATNNDLPDAAPVSFHVPNGLGAVAAVGAALVAGGAFVL